MSSWWSDWHRLRARLHAQARVLDTTSKSVGADAENYGLMFALARAEATALHDALESFLATHGDVLPEGARTGLQTLVDLKPVLTDFSNPASFGSASTVLGFKLAAIDYDLTDREARARNLVERAFLHLDRSLVVDEDVRQKWIDALGISEAACEARGGPICSFTDCGGSRRTARVSEPTWCSARPSPPTM